MRRSISIGLVAIALAFGAANTASADPIADGYAAFERADYPETLRIWEPLAKKGDRLAQSLLGAMHYHGQGVPQNYAEAVKWYRLAAEQGDAGARTDLGEMYRDGKGVPQNHAEAAKWYRLAADEEYARAQNNLGEMHEKGQGVPQNYAEAVKWYRLAAETNWTPAGIRRGEAEAQKNLGNMYKDGKGVPQNYTEAAKWFRLAADQGNVEAQTNLRSMHKDGLMHKDCLKEKCRSDELAHYMVTKEKDDVAKLWEIYSKRQKSLIEQVLNYSTTALVEGYHEREVSPIVRNFGSSSAFWVEDKEGSGKCTATLIEFDTVSATFAARVAFKRIASEIERNPTMRNKIILEQIENNIKNRKNIEIKKLNIGGFRIEEIRDCPSRGNCDGRPIRQYRFGDEQQNFTAPNNEQLMSRMKSAWQLAFKECPGTRTPF